MICCSGGGLHESFFCCTSYISDNSESVVNDTVDGKDNMEKKTTEVTER